MREQHLGGFGLQPVEAKRRMHHVFPLGKHSFEVPIYFSMYSSCQRLPNGNTLICEGAWGRLFEVNTSGELVWEYVNNLPSCEISPVESKSCQVYSAYRYRMDYSGLKRHVSLAEETQPEPGTEVTEDKALEA